MPGGAARSPGRPPALAADAAPELRSSPAARLSCPGAPSSLPGVGELRLAEKRPSSPVPDAQSRGSDEKAKKDAEKGTPPGLGLATSRSPPEVPSSHRHPAGKGHSERPGRGGRARGASWGAGFLVLPQRKLAAPGVGLPSALSAFLRPPRLPHCSQPLGLGSRTSAPRPPRPSPTPPAPPP